MWRCSLSTTGRALKTAALRTILTISLLVTASPSSFAEAGSASSPQKNSVRVLKNLEGFLYTVNKGAEEDRPPFINLFRSRDGVLFKIREFERIRNRRTRAKVRHIARELRQVDFDTEMVISVLTLPTDNFHLSLKGVINHGNMIEVSLRYGHKDISYQILPLLKIYYLFLVVEKSDLPVILNATPFKTKKSGKKTASVQTIFGVLKQWENMEKTLGVVKKVKNKVFIYYIREPKWKEKLSPHIGKFVGVKGHVVKEQGSVFEAEIKITKIVRGPGPRKRR